MFTSAEEALRFVKDQEVEMVDLTFTDLIGRLHHITLPPSAFEERVFELGVAFDSSSVPGFKIRGGSDVVLIPDAKSGRLDPFWEFKTIAFTCNIFEAGGKNPFDLDPRNVLIKAEEYLAQTGIAEGAKFGPEYEFYIFDGVKIKNEPHQSYYSVISEEADWNLKEEEIAGSGYKIPYQSGYHAAPPRDAYFSLRAEMVARMVEEGIRVKYHHHEVGASGQLEIEVLFEEPLKAADQGMLVKYISRMTAVSYGKTVTFMPKPLYRTAGSGMHFHQFLHRDGKSLFYRKGGEANLSQIALNYIGGLLKHTPAVMGFTNPSTNSYKRLVPGFEAPTRIFFGLANRSACIRVPKYDDNEFLKRIEFRPADGTGNIYLSIAVQLLAGLDGVKKEIDAVAHNFGPINEDIQTLPADKVAHIGSIPNGLCEALSRLDEDREFLTSTGVFSNQLIDTWIEYKMEKEHYEMRNRPHPFELELYFDI